MGTVIHRATLRLIESANTPDYQEPDWKVSPDLSAVAGVPSRYWKWDAILDRPDAMTAPERRAKDDAERDVQRDSATAQIDGPEDILRAVIAVLVAELNRHAQTVTALLDSIDAANSLGALKARVALIADVPERTMAEVRAAIRARMGA